MYGMRRSLAGAAGAFLIAAHAAAQTSVGAGAEFTTGKYGGRETTETLYLPFFVKHETGPWVFKATVPYLRISGPANVIGAGEEFIALPGGSTARRTESGLGDVVVSAFYNVSNERRSGLGLDLGVKVKLPTADEDRGLGTGKTDYAVQADFFRPFPGFTLFGSLGYRWYGDPAGTDLRNVPYGAIGASRRLSQETTVGVAYDHRPRNIRGGSEISEVMGYLSQRVSREWKLQVYGVVGFSDASPDAGIGAVVERRF